MVHFAADDPLHWLRRLRRKARDGQLPTWSVDDDGDFFHDTKDKQWRGYFIRPHATTTRLSFGVITTRGSVVPAKVYSALQGRWVSALLSRSEANRRIAHATVHRTSLDGPAE